MSINKTIDNYKESANIKHNNKYDYSQIIELIKTHTKVKIICPKHGLFEQSFSKHLSGDGCKKCGIEKSANERIRKANNKFIKEAGKLHNNKYDYSKSNYISAKENIIIICQIHGDFEQTPNSHQYFYKNLMIILATIYIFSIYSIKNLIRLSQFYYSIG